MITQSVILNLVQNLKNKSDPEIVDPDPELDSGDSGQGSARQQGLALVFCHPEPGPELVSGSTISGSWFLDLRIWVLKPRL